VRGEAGAELAFKGCSWFSTYRIHHRSASRFRINRCFVLGDAAHIHSPMGAQGMNTGLQDAYNLGWKLALVVQGRADLRLLDSYESERLPVARRLLRTTDRAFRLVVADNALAGLFAHPDPRPRCGLRDEPRAHPAGGVSRGVADRQSITAKARCSKTMADLPSTAPRAGDRFPWLKLRFTANGAVEDLFDKFDDTRITLIAFGQAVPPDAVPDDDLLACARDTGGGDERTRRLRMRTYRSLRSTSCAPTVTSDYAAYGSSATWLHAISPIASP